MDVSHFFLNESITDPVGMIPIEQVIVGHIFYSIAIFVRMSVKGVALAAMIQSYNEVKLSFKRELVDLGLIQSIIHKIQSRPVRVWFTKEGFADLFVSEGAIEEEREHDLHPKPA